MQRIEVNFNEKEYLTMKKWLKGEYTGVEEIEKEIFIKGEKEQVFLNFSKVKYDEVSLKIKSNKAYLIDNSNGIGLEEITFDKISKLMGVFSLSKKYLKEEILIKLTKEYEENGYYKSYKEYKQSELNTIKYFTWRECSHNLFNTIKYFDFENKGELSLAIYSYVNYVYNYGRVTGGIEEFIETKLDMLGYERNPKLKGKRPIYEKKDELNFKSMSPKSLDYAIENLLEVFYKNIDDDIEEDASEVARYSYILSDHCITNDTETPSA